MSRASPAGRFSRYNIPSCPVGEHIEDAVRVDAHVAEPPEPMLDEMLLPDGAARAECQTQQSLAGERADPHDALRRIGLDREAGRGDGDGRPIMHRLLQTRFDPFAVADR